MKLNAEQDILGGWYGRDYDSPFPSREDQLNGKFRSIRKAGDAFTAGLAVLEQSRAFSEALSICNAAKAVHVGDLLTDWLPKTAWMGKGLGGSPIVQGLFAAVPWDATVDPEVLGQNMMTAGLSVAMTTLAAIPVYGQIAAALVAVGVQLFSLFAAPEDDAAKSLLLPWTDYTKSTDEVLVGTCKDTIFRSVDWSRIFMPPFERGFPWVRGVVAGKGMIFGPANAQGNELAWSDGYGVMPGTFKMAGQVQLMWPNSLPKRLERFVLDMNANPNHISWSGIRTICGEYYPGTVQLGAAAWQQVMAKGNPDMFKIETYSLERAWKIFFEELFNSAIGDLTGAKNGLKRDNDQEVSQAVEAYICWRLQGQQEWTLGTPPGFRPSPFFHENFWADGPVRTDERNACLFIEQDRRDGKRRLWPYTFDRKNYPAQHPQLRSFLDPAGVARLPPKSGAPKGYRCVPYPPAELASAEYASPFAVFVQPQIQALRARQIQCLQHTIVSAYVRPVESKSLPAYAAFVGADGKAMQAACLDARAKLLASPARFAVNLKDVDDLDPPFAAKLRAAGVTNSFAQRASATTVAGVAGDGKVQPPPPPGGGVAFDNLVAPPLLPPGPNGRGGAGALAALFAIFAGYKLLR